MLSALVAVGLIIVGLVVAGGNAGLTHPITTALNVGHPFPVASKGTAHKAGTWRLVDDLVHAERVVGPDHGAVEIGRARDRLHRVRRRDGRVDKR